VFEGAVPENLEDSTSYRRHEMCRGLRGQLRLLGLSLLLFAAQQIVFSGHISAAPLEPLQCEGFCTINESCESECFEGYDPTTCGAYVLQWGDGSPAVCCDTLGCGESCTPSYTYTPVGTWGRDNYDWVYHNNAWWYELVSCTYYTTYLADDSECNNDYCLYDAEFTEPNPPFPGYCCWAYSCGGSGSSC
jgi:hypothetical protein